MTRTEIQEFKRFLHVRNIFTMFSDNYRQKGIEVKFKPGTSGLQFNNAELASHLIELLDLNPEKEYFLIGIEVLAETKDYLLFMLKK